MHGDTATLWGHVLLFLTTMAGFVYQWMREGRHHRWQQEALKQLSDQVVNGGSGQKRKPAESA